MEPELIGIVRADISSMFFEEQSRPTGDDPSIVQYLTKVFDGGRCDRYDPEYFVSGFITPKERDLLLGDPFIRRRLRDSLMNPSYPRIQLQEKIDCLHGYHRVRAAESLWGDNPMEMWWMVKLYCPTSDGKSITQFP
jgi:hypothetical protein